MAEVRLTLEEYEALRRMITSERESEGAELAAAEEKPKRRSRGNRKNDKMMSAALAQANSEMRKVNGDLRKGKTQADVMRRAHKIKKGMK